LTGVAATRTSASPAPGFGTGLSTNASASAPSYERSSSARIVAGIVFGSASFILFSATRLK
jgi:hypothetical protein